VIGLYGTQFIAVMPTNLYGPNDNFDLQTSHVMPALIRKFHEAKANNQPEVVVWGSGTPRKLLDVSRLHALGWQHATPLESGIARAHAAFLKCLDK